MADAISIKEDEILKLEAEIDVLNDELFTANSNLSSIKTALSEERLPDKLFKKYLEAKQVYINDKNECLSKKRKLKLQLRKLHTEKEVLKRDFLSERDRTVRDDLQDLKDKYLEFYKDKSRISSMRKMANEFIIDIDKIIKNL